MRCLINAIILIATTLINFMFIIKENSFIVAKCYIWLINSNLFKVRSFRASLSPVNWEAKKEDYVRDVHSGLSPVNYFLHDSEQVIWVPMSISKKAYLGCEDQMRCCKWNFFKKVLWYSCDEKKYFYLVTVHKILARERNGHGLCIYILKW